MGINWVPSLLEVLENIMQHQYHGNVHVAYGIMTRQALFRDLEKLASEVIEPAKTTDTNGSTVGTDSLQHWKEIHLLLRPILGLMDVVIPKLEAEVQEKDIANPEDAKDLLPRSILGLLPVPRTFSLRSHRYTELTHRACEHCLIACVANGPIASLWDTDDDSDAGADVSPQKDSAKGKAAPSRDFSPHDRSTAVGGAIAAAAGASLQPNGQAQSSQDSEAQVVEERSDELAEDISEGADEDKEDDEEVEEVDEDEDEEEEGEEEEGNEEELEHDKKVQKKMPVLEQGDEEPCVNKQKNSKTKRTAKPRG